MSTRTRVAAFLVGLLAVFGLTLAAGSAVAPITTTPPAPRDGADDARSVPATPGLPGGLAVSQGGYTLEPVATTLPPGTRDFSFRILGPDGPVTAYDVQHDKELHLIAVRRDFAGYQHVHPTLDGDTWSTDLDLSAGSWRVLADFRPTDGPALTLGADLAVPGTTVAEDRGESRIDRVDGYTVELQGDLVAGTESGVRLVVSRDGEQVDRLDRYLGATGHLVALREGDLAYLHVHPTSSVGGSVGFLAEVPSASTYHLYFDFRHDGGVRTADFTVTAAPGDPQREEGDDDDDDDHGH